jgi:hypothetical protein
MAAAAASDDEHLDASRNLLAEVAAAGERVGDAANAHVISTPNADTDTAVLPAYTLTTPPVSRLAPSVRIVVSFPGRAASNAR